MNSLKKIIKYLFRPIYFDLALYIVNNIIAKVPSHNFRKLFYRGVMNFTIGDGSSIFMGAWFDSAGNFVVGKNSVINQKCRLDNRGGIFIGDNVSISAEVCILTADHDPHTRDFAGRDRPVRIENHVFVGTRAMILPGITLGRGCVVCAGAVVTKDVDALAIVAGIPARQIRTREPSLDYTVNYSRLFH